MILLAALLMTPLAPGCRQIEGAIRCELAPPVRAAAPPRARAATTVDMAPTRHARPSSNGGSRARKVVLRPSSPPTSAEIAHHVDLLVAAADCTGARTLVAATESPAAADTLFHTCVGTARRPAPPGHDPSARTEETASASHGTSPADGP